MYVVDLAASTKALVVLVMERRLKRDGGYQKPTPVELEKWHVEHLADADDREVMGILTALDVRASADRKRFDLPPAIAAMLLPRIGVTRRVLVKNGNDFSPAEFDGGRRLERTLSVTAADGGYALRVALACGGEPVDSPRLLAGNSFALVGSSLVRTSTAANKLVDAVQRAGGVAVPAKDRELLARALHLYAPPGFIAPKELGAEVVEDEASMRVLINLSEPGIVEALTVFRYGDVDVPADAPDGYVTQGERSYNVRRDRAAERAGLDTIAELFNGWDARKPMRFHPYELPNVVRKLGEASIEVLANQKPTRTGHEVSASVSSGTDWFELHGEATFPESGGDTLKASLHKVMDAIATRSPYVVLDDGTLGLLPDEWLSRYAGLARAVSLTNDGKRFDRSRAAVLNVLIARLENVVVDEEFSRTRHALDGFRGAEAAEPSDRFHGSLRPYQREGLGWLLALDELDLHGCLADEMGLGKTVQVLAWLTSRKGSGAPSLVVAPRSVVHNWVDEARKFAPSLSVVAHIDSGRARTAGELATYDIVVTSYGTLSRDVALLAQQTFDVVVLDEAQVIKNEETVTAKAARTLRCRRRIALSGTPIENHLGELWSIFEFLSPGLLGTPAFQRALESDSRKPDVAIRQLVTSIVRPFVLRRTKKAVAPDLPEKQEQTILVDLNEEQRRIYESLRIIYRDQVLAKVDELGLAKAKVHVLEGLLRLRQAACHPGLVAPEFAKTESSKLEAFFAMLDEVREAEGKVLVFSQFTSLLGLVRETLDARGVRYAYLDGGTRDRAAVVAQFQDDPATRTMLVSLKAGGTGLNLTAADYVFILDPWWNPAAEAQAIDRAHRIGRTRSVFAYKMVARGTVEERILELQQSKAALAESILGGEGTTLRGMTQHDLQMLFG